MATVWKNLTPEQKDELNAKRRSKRATATPEVRDAVREADRARKPASPGPTSFNIRNPDGTYREVHNPEMAKLFTRLNRRVELRKARFKGRCARIQKWQESGGQFPWPSMQDKLEATGFWNAVANVLGRKCSCCEIAGPEDHPDTYWRLTRKDDFLAFVGHSKSEYLKVLRSPGEYQLYCLWCVTDLRITCFAWIYSPDSSRNGGRSGFADMAAPKYRKLAPIFETIYPTGDTALRSRIQAGAIRSLSCEITNSSGDVIPSLIRKKQYHAWVGQQPRICFNIPDYTPIVDSRGRIVEGPQKETQSSSEAPEEVGTFRQDVGTL